MLTFQFLFLFSLNCVYTCSSYEITRISDPIEHGEGPHWDSKTQTLYLVNTFNPMVIRLKDGKMTTQTIVGPNSIGTVTPIANSNSKFLITCDTSVILLDWDGLKNDSGTYTTIIENFEPDLPNNQANDGKADSLGRFWIGTLTRNDDLSVTIPGGSLYVIEKDCKTISKQLGNLTVSNGFAWNKDNTKFYYIDSQERNIVSYDYNHTEGSIANPEVLYNLADCTDLKSSDIADGMTIDADDNLWVAILGGSTIINVNTTNGQLIQKINMPISYITSVAFGGENLDELYVTTSRIKCSSTLLQKEPFSGSTYVITGLGVKGVPMNDYVFSGGKSNLFMNSGLILFILFYITAIQP